MKWKLGLYKAFYGDDPQLLQPSGQKVPQRTDKALSHILAPHTARHVQNAMEQSQHAGNPATLDAYQASCMILKMDISRDDKVGIAQSRTN